MSNHRGSIVGVLLCVAALSVLARDVPARSDPYSEIFGNWRITKLVGGADIVSLSDGQARALIGKPFAVSADRFVFDGKTCRKPEYIRRLVQPDKYFRDEWHANSSRLPLPAPATIIENNCYDVFLARKGHLVIAVEGVFFEAIRDHRAGKARTFATGSGKRVNQANN